MMLTALPLLLTTGCSQEQVDVYLFLLGQIDPVSEGTELTHNFTGGYEPEATSDWTNTEDGSASEQLLFGELVVLADDTALLQIMGSSYPGFGDGGSWTFTWEDYDRGQTSATHDAGYSYITDYENSRKDTIKLSEGDEGGLNGTWETSTVTGLDQSENDTWGQDVGLPNGQIQVAGRVVKDDGFGNEIPVSNAGTTADCDSSPCILQYTESADTTRTISGVLTDLTPEDLERDVDDYGQQQGF